MYVRITNILKIVALYIKQINDNVLEYNDTIVDIRINQIELSSSQTTTLEGNQQYELQTDGTEKDYSSI